MEGAQGNHLPALGVFREGLRGPIQGEPASYSNESRACRLTCPQESSDSCITLQDDSPDVVNSLLQFLYSADYDVDAHDDEEGTPMSFHVHVYAIADKVSEHQPLHNVYRN